jgi:hypothetical protein
MIGKTDEVLGLALNASRYAIGDDGFVEETEAELKDMHLEKGVTGDVVMPKGPEIPVVAVEAAVAHEFGIDAAGLHNHGHRAGIAKAVAVELCCELSGLNQRAVAVYYGYKTDAGVSGQHRAFKGAVLEDSELLTRMQKIKRHFLHQTI